MNPNNLEVKTMVFSRFSVDVSLGQSIDCFKDSSLKKAESCGILFVVRHDSGTSQYRPTCSLHVRGVYAGAGWSTLHVA